MKAVIGVVPRYKKLDGDVNVIYITENIRRTFQQEGCEIELLLPVQNVDSIDIKNSEFPPLTKKEKEEIENKLNKCDALVIPGGKKSTPYDLYLLDQAIKKDMPVLGICLGMQVMSYYNDNSDKKLKLIKSDIKHNYEDDNNSLAHKVILAKYSKLYNIFKKEELLVNSFHKYMAFENKNYRVIAKSEDGIIEALEYPKSTFNVGIQWHPEISYSFDNDSKLLIKYFVKEAVKYSVNKEKKKQLINI